MPKFFLDFPHTKPEIIAEIYEQIANDKFALKPEFTQISNLRKPEAYKRLQNQEQKSQFQEKLLKALTEAWHREFGARKCEELITQFLDLIQQTNTTGALIFADLIDRNNFSNLVNAYDHILEQYGNKSWLHSYVNLANHIDFLNNDSFQHAFLHPLMMAIIAYQIGGAIRIVDTRAKNAEPISVKAQDNMLHIDNTPFNDEYKVILTWEKGKVSGPKGQNFVVIPGTHKGARNSFLRNDTAFSTENGSIFITEDTVQQVFDAQKEILGTSEAQVIEITDKDRPLTTLFAAGSLVHHRYRKKEGFSRSCTILAFHRASDNPGQFMIPSALAFEDMSELNKLLFGYQDETSETAFINAVANEWRVLADKLKEIRAGQNENTVVINPANKTLSEPELSQWKKAVTSAPTIEQIKRKTLKFPLNETFDEIEMFNLLGSLMIMDKHGPLDLILYEDNHEEVRKWARNRIREMNKSYLSERLAIWMEYLSNPQIDQVLLPNQIVDITNELLVVMGTVPNDIHVCAKLDLIETIAPELAFRSLKQLVIDLREAIVRCDTDQTFLSTSLFIFWSANEFAVLFPEYSDQVKDIGARLLAHYLATNILIEKHHQNLHQKKTVDRQEASVVKLSNHSIFSNSETEKANNDSAQPLISCFLDLNIHL